MRRFVAFLLCLIVAIGPAWPQALPFPGPGGVGVTKTWTLTNHGTSYGTTGARTISPSATITVGSLVVVCFVERTNTGTSPTVTDTGLNTYTSIKHQILGSGATGYVDILYSNLTTQLTGASVITGTSVNGSDADGMLILSASVGGTVDTAVTVGQGSDASGSVFATLTSGTPAQSNELFVACGANSNNAMVMANDTGNGWAVPFTSGGESGSGASDIAGGGGSQVNGGTGTKSYAPTVSSGGPNSASVIVGFK